MYTSNSNASWAKERGAGSTPYPLIESVNDLKHSPQFAVVTPDECVALAERMGNESELTLQPLMGGLDPDISWRSLRFFESAVLPRLIDIGLRPTPTPRKSLDNAHSR